MFINCPHCGALVATDPATDQPPSRCPRCAASLREDPAPAADAGGGAAGALDAAIHAAVPPPAAAGEDPPPVQDVAVAAEPPGAQALPAVVAPATGDTATGASAEGPGQEAADMAGATMPGVGGTADAVAPRTARPGTPAPSFARARGAPVAPAPIARRWLLPAGIAALSLLLAVQWLLADRDRLAADARWRPLVLQACAVLRCSVPAWREPAALSLLDRDVRPHPRQPGVLRVNATFRNDARWPQAWPGILLTLSDIDGRVVAARTFAPAEYLGAPPARAALAPGQSAAIRMDVVEPAAGIVAFAFAFE